MYPDVKDAAGNDAFRSLFLSGEVRFLNAYPESLDRDMQPMLPVPLSLFVKKNAGENPDVYDFTVDPDPEPEEQFETADFEYVDWSDDNIRWKEIRKQRSMHQRRDRNLGRSEGTIFHYESIAPEQCFVGRIEMEDDAHMAILLDILSKFDFNFGRSKSTEYGGMPEIEKKSIKVLNEGEVDFWEFKPLKGEHESLVVTLLSDYLGRSSDGEMTSDTFKEDLARGLGQSSDLCEIRCYVKKITMPGYNTTWKCRRPDQPALAAGSVFVYELPASEIKSLVLSIGERTTEGFGRVAVNWHGVYPDGEVFKAIEQKNKRIDYRNADVDTSALHELKSRMLLQWAREKIQLGASKAMPVQSKDEPPPSAFSQLRSCLRLYLEQSRPGNWEAIIETGVGKKSLDRLKRFKVKLPGWKKEMDNIVSITRTACSDEGFEVIMKWIDFQENDIGKCPDFLADAALGEDDQQLIRDSFFDNLLDHFRRAAKERNND